LGKVLARRILPELENETAPRLKHDSSTNNLIRRYRGINTLRRIWFYGCRSEFLGRVSPHSEIVRSGAIFRMKFTLGSKPAGNEN